MKVVVVTGLTPTPENKGGISALIYSTIYFRPKEVETKIYTFNINHVCNKEIANLAEQLRSEIKVIPIPSKFIKYSKNEWLTRYDKFFRWNPLKNDLINKQFVKTLKKETCDFILLYPFYMSSLANLISEQRFVVSGPDCETFNRSRRLSNPFRLHTRKTMIDDFIYLQKNKATEELWGKDNIRVHYVGMNDYKFYRDVIGHSNAHFLLHPYVKYKEKRIDFSHEKLKVIIPGCYDMYYNTDVDKMLPALIANKEKLQETFEFTFLGKHWYPIDERLKAAGFKAEFKTWVEDYAEELVQHDIEITPISFGTGTKGKVLDAMVNGLLVVGSGYALENICVRDMESCVRYRDASHIASILISIANNREKYQAIAEKGRQQVMKYHNPERISKRFFEIYGKEFGVI